ncbi:hypothetical protein EZJ49_09485 [Bdellovibrio bacteriovorus]|uniref:hypothetical protein n=1 Tax=Bdellovibrio bacteriovorus TaxID=959 RepID=UPI0021CE0CB1|nr:hypothetical protein [Bdellovibrio bacteriovorus]UXR63306.1 hypothetical protein EZJ49_09485 [Bdellovibrio bacteriovorus]
MASAENFDSCMAHALKTSFPRIAEGEKSQLFVKCTTEKSVPQPGQARPRYSTGEIKALSQAFAAITDCLEIDPQWLFPKLMMESGFHTLIQNPNGDAGIGQLTGKAITDVDQVLPVYKNMIYQSSRKSCQWLKVRTQARTNFWKPVKNERKCALMNKTSNPLRNLLYAGIFHKLNEKYVATEFEKRHIPALLKEAGYAYGDYTQIKRLLVTLGYNTGGAVAVKNLEQFLFSRVDFIRRKSQEFNLQLLGSLSPADRAQALSYVSPKDFDFKKGLKDFQNHKKNLKEQLQQQNRQLTDDQVDVAASRLLRNVSASLYTFPEWLQVWQSHGGPGYVSSLAQTSLQLEKKFGSACSNSDNYRVIEAAQ